MHTILVRIVSNRRLLRRGLHVQFIVNSGTSFW